MMAQQPNPNNLTVYDGSQDPTVSSLPEPAFPPMGEEGEDGEQETTAPSLEDRLAALEAAREEERKQFEGERQRWQTTVDRLLQGQAAPQQPAEQQPPQMPEVNLSGMPDPVDKPQEYQAELARRMNTAMQQQTQLVRQQFEAHQRQTSQTTSQERELDQLWETFKGEYSDLADKQVTLNGAVAAEMRDMQRRGVDPMQGIFSDKEGFMRNVADRMRKELGSPAPGGDKITPPPNRTQGLGNGTKVNGNSAGKGEKSKGFIDQLKQSQLNDGLI